MEKTTRMNIPWLVGHPLADHLTLEEELLIKTADSNTEEVDQVKEPAVYIVAGENMLPVRSAQQLE